MYARLFIKDRDLDSNTRDIIPKWRFHYMSSKPLKSHHIEIFKTAFAQPLIQREQRSLYALCLKQLHKQSTYTVDYISVLQTLNNNESIGMKVFNPYIDSDVAAAAIKMSSLIHLWN